MISFPLIAVDIGTSSLKVMETTNGKHTKIKKIGIEVLPESIVVDGRVENYGALADILDKLIKKAKIKTFGKRAVISVSGDEVIIKKVAIPFVDGANFFEAVESEAEQSFHADLSELHWEYRILEDYPMCPEGHKVVVLVAASRDVIDQKLEVIHHLKMKAAVIDCDIFSILNMFEKTYGNLEGLSMILNVGSTSSQMILVQDGFFVYGRNFAAGGINYTQNIEADMSIDATNAETLKISASMGSENIPQECLESISASNVEYLEQVTMVMDDFKGEDPDYAEVPISKVFLVGGGAQTLGLSTALASHFEVEVEFLDPFQNVSPSGLPKDQAHLANYSSLFGVACGLSLRNFKDNADEIAKQAI